MLYFNFLAQINLNKSAKTMILERFSRISSLYNPIVMHVRKNLYADVSLSNQELQKSSRFKVF